ncbi:hypothetical protein [Thermoactinomyces sp. DSM 45892]|uniref:hypothetical protein n=1 Tax=Thermoactinomyces sp. DSM 45892 TaxID=1882753 RepID=UPI000897C2FF|nr:hypothetical protein [Thermoactinomyces sp. DSM 45892]SDZ16120.1 hypothetical protein SAMN05444416_1152 [Thermoactinomyces sp. DSM 45892]
MNESERRLKELEDAKEKYVLEPESELELLKEEVAQLREMVEFLSFSKVTNEKYAFWDWCVQHNIFGDTRTRLGIVKSVLTNRLTGQETLKKNIPGVSMDVLYSPSPPSYQEAKKLLMEAIDTQNEETIEELFRALHNQGIFQDLTALYPHKL